MIYAIETEGLLKRFRRTDAVNGLSLKVPKGSVYGFIGRNGAGKTTTIKMLMGSLKPSGGRVRILDKDPLAEAVWVRQHIGYVSEDRTIYGWMTIGEFLWFVQQAYPSWQPDLASKYLGRFDLSPDIVVRTLSRGMLGKLLLVAALAHQPDILILDEPTSGLDAVVRREFLEGIIDLIQEEGRTVFFSSHNLSDVERVADHIGLIQNGRLIIEDSLESLKRRFRKFSLTFDGPLPALQGDPLVTRVSRQGDQLTVLVDDADEQFERALSTRHRPKTLDRVDLSLEDLFSELTAKEGKS